MAHLNPSGWRKSSRSGANGQRVELHGDGAVRDSKNPSGPLLRVGWSEMVAAVKAGRYDHR